MSQGFDFSFSSFLYAYTPRYYSFIVLTDTNCSSANALMIIIDIINAAACGSDSPYETRCKLTKGHLAAIIYIFMGLKWYTTSKVSKLEYLPTLL